MKMKDRSLRLLLMVLLPALVLAGSVSAQEAEQAHVLTLASSGYERAHALAFSPDGKYLAAGGISGIYLFDFQKLSPLEFLQTNTWARSVSFVPGTGMLAAGLFDRTIKIWTVPGGSLLQTLNGPQGWIRSISISADGSMLASASDDDTLRIYETGSGKAILVIEQASGIRAVALSPDGRLAAGALGDNSVRIWGVPTGKLLHTLSGHTDWVRCLAFSPDGRLLASGSFDKTIRLWNAAYGSLVRTLEGHTSSVLSVAFSPDGTKLASGSVDETARLWKADTGDPIGLLKGHTDFVYAVAFAPDGQFLVSGGGDNSVRIWDLDALGMNAAEPNISTEPGPASSTDCRNCHHRRGDLAAASVLELSCEGCHGHGAGLSWCAAFPRGATGGPIPTSYQHVVEASGIPVSSPGIAIVIHSPANGETLYTRFDRHTPATISGKVFAKDIYPITEVKIRLDIQSEGNPTVEILTYPKENGEFIIPLYLNEGNPPASGRGLFACPACHGKSGVKVGLPNGSLRIKVTAIAPDGAQARDERWLRVDTSGEVKIPVHVLDSSSGLPIAGLSVQATTLLYEWRSRAMTAVTDAEGNAWLELEQLSLEETTYEVGIPEQVIDGVLYHGSENMQLVLEPGQKPNSIPTLFASAQSGSIIGVVQGEGRLLEGTSIWALRMPAGPAYQVSLSPTQTFEFEHIPVDSYFVFADPFSLDRLRLRSEGESADLIKNAQGVVTLGTAQSHTLTGRITSQDGSPLPFAWVQADGSGKVIPLNPVTGEFLLEGSAFQYVTVSAPGYYSLTQRVDASRGYLDFSLIPRYGLTHIPWGTGEVILATENEVQITSGLISLDSGWLWGKGGALEPLHILLPDVDVVISSGEFALERTADERIAWLYLSKGGAQVTTSSGTVDLEGGQMIALIPGSVALPLERSLAAILHPALQEAPVRESVEPTASALLHDWMVKTGIRSAQILTLVAYVLSFAALIGIPLYALGRRTRGNRTGGNS